MSGRFYVEIFDRKWINLPSFSHHTKSYCLGVFDALKKTLKPCPPIRVLNKNREVIKEYEGYSGHAGGAIIDIEFKVNESRKK